MTDYRIIDHEYFQSELSIKVDHMKITIGDILDIYHKSLRGVYLKK